MLYEPVGLFRNIIYNIEDELKNLYKFLVIPFKQLVVLRKLKMLYKLIKQLQELKPMVLRAGLFQQSIQKVKAHQSFMLIAVLIHIELIPNLLHNCLEQICRRPHHLLEVIVHHQLHNRIGHRHKLQNVCDDIGQIKKQLIEPVGLQDPFKASQPLDRKHSTLLDLVLYVNKVEGGGVAGDGPHESQHHYGSTGTSEHLKLGHEESI
jgi:hypothetical protein